MSPTIHAERAEPFAGLAELQEQHGALARAVGTGVLAHAEPIANFVRRAQATGAVLDAREDRAAAQGLINFWTSRLGSAARSAARTLKTESSSMVEAPQFEDTLLAEFEEDTLHKATSSADAWLAEQSEADQALARRILQRLLRLREDGTFEVLQRVAGVCDGLEPRERADMVLGKLVEAGVVRLLTNPTGAPDVALRSPELLDQWDRLKEGAERRRAFREKARQWARRRATKAPKAQASAFAKLAAKLRAAILRLGEFIDHVGNRCRTMFRRVDQPTEAFISRKEYEEAEAYRDRIVAELELVYHKREHDKDRAQRQKQRNVVLTLLVVVFAALAFFGWELAMFARNEEKRAQEEAATAEREKVLRDRVLDSMLKSRNAVRLASLAESSLAGSPQESLLLATEGWRLGTALPGEFSKIEKKELGQAAMQGLSMLDEAKRQTEETLRRVLSGVGGRGFDAGLGPIVHLAAHEGVSANQGKEMPSEQANELQMIAALDIFGRIALWDLNKSPTAKFLDPSLRHATGLAFARNGQHLIAWTNDKQIALWDLRKTEPMPRSIEGYQYARVHVSPYGHWIETDDSRSRGKFVFLGAHGLPREYPFTFKESLTTQSSYSNDGRWFARITAAGEALVWKLQGDVEPAPVHLKGTTKKASRVLSGVFLNGGRRLLIFFSDGSARSWDLESGDWTPAKDDNLQDIAQVKYAAAIANSTGTHLILIPPPVSAGAAPKAPVVAGDAFCFDGRRLQTPMRLVGFDRNRLVGMPVVDAASGRWLGACFNTKEDGVRIWDLESAAKPDARILSRNYTENNVQLTPTPFFPWFVVKRKDNTLRLIQEPGQPQEPNVALQLRGHDGPVTEIAYSQEGRWLVSGGQDGTVRAWRLYAISPSAEPYVYRSPSQRGIVATPDKRWLVVALADGSLRFRRIEEGSLTNDRHVSPTTENRIAAALSTCARGDWLLEHPPNLTTAPLWDLRGKSPKAAGRLEIGKGPVRLMLATPDGQWLAVQPNQGDGLLWNLSRREKKQGGQPGRDHPEHVQPDERVAGTIMALLPNGRRLLARTEEAYRIIDFSNGLKVTRTIPRVKGQVLNEKVSPDGANLVISAISFEKIGPDQVMTRVFDLLGDKVEGQELSLAPFGDFFVGQGEILCGSKEPAPLAKDAADDYEGLYYWRLRGEGKGMEKELIRTDPEVEDDLARRSRLVTLSPDRRCFVTHEKAKKCERWVLWRFDPETRALKSEGLAEMSSAKFTSDSSWLVAARGGAIRIYSTTGKERVIRELEKAEFQGEIMAAARTPDGRWLALVGQDWRIRVWDLNETQPIPVFLLPGQMLDAPSEILFSRDGARIYSFFANAVRVSHTQMGGKEGIVAKAAEVVGRNFRRLEWPSFLGDYRATFPDFPVEHHAVLLNVTDVLTVEDAVHDIRDGETLYKKEYRVKLEKGRLYNLEMRSSAFDAYLVLRNSAKKTVAQDDDSGGNLDARIRFWCPATEEFTVVATMFQGHPGQFRLTIDSVHLQMEQAKARGR